RAGSAPLRCSAALTAALPKTGAGTSANAPLKEPNGVLAPLDMNTGRFIDLASAPPGGACKLCSTLATPLKRVSSQFPFHLPRPLPPSQPQNPQSADSPHRA